MGYDSANGYETIELPLVVPDAIYTLIGAFPAESLTRLIKGLQATLDAINRADPDALPREERLLMPESKTRRRLTPEQRIDILSRRQRGESYAAIASAVGCSIPTVNATISRSRRASSTG